MDKHAYMPEDTPRMNEAESRAVQLWVNHLYPPEGYKEDPYKPYRNPYGNEGRYWVVVEEGRKLEREARAMEAYFTGLFLALGER